LTTFGNPGHKVAPFTFTNQDGQPFTEKNMEGKIYVVEYFFTTCEGICPKMNDNMVSVFQAYRGQNDVAILSHTVDPETDTVEQLKRYALKYDADPAQWNFVTGDKQALYSMAINSYLVTAVEDTTQKDILPDFIHNVHNPNFGCDCLSKTYIKSDGIDLSFNIFSFFVYNLDSEKGENNNNYGIDSFFCLILSN
jgi:protein SCO1/2